MTKIIVFGSVCFEQQTIAGGMPNVLRALRTTLDLFHLPQTPEVKGVGHVGHADKRLFESVLSEWRFDHRIIGCLGHTRRNKVIVRPDGTEYLDKPPHGFTVSRENIAKLYAALSDLGPGDILVLSGSEAQYADFDGSIFPDLITFAHEREAKVVLDAPEATLLDIFKTDQRPDIWKANRLELSTVAGTEVNTDADRLRFAEQLLPNGLFIATYGRHVLARSKDGKVRKVSVQLPRGYQDITHNGRGDSAVGAWLAALYSGLSQGERLKYAACARVANTTTPVSAGFPGSLVTMLMKNHLEYQVLDPRRMLAGV